jgi:hypothetical protein
MLADGAEDVDHEEGEPVSLRRDLSPRDSWFFSLGRSVIDNAERVGPANSGQNQDINIPLKSQPLMDDMTSPICWPKRRKPVC